jgi:hypothetical protein
MRHLKYYQELNEQSNPEKDRVIAIQKALKKAGFGESLGDSGPNKDGVDGIFGERTKSAVIEFQKKNGINPTGNVGKITAPKLGIKYETLANSTKVNNDASKVPVIKQSPNKEDYLMFNGNFLYWMNPDGKYKKKWKACSGRTQYHLAIDKEIWMDRYKISPKDWSKYKDVGPTPEGEYMMGPLMIREIPDDWLDRNAVSAFFAKQVANSFDSSIEAESKHEWSDKTFYSRVAWGSARGSLRPLKGTNTFGRGSMYLHGGSLPGSIGCIDLVTGIKDFAGYWTEWSRSSGKKEIKLKVDYSTFNPNIPVETQDQPFKLPDFNSSELDNFLIKSNEILSDTLKKENVKIPKEMVLDKKTGSKPLFFASSDRRNKNTEEALT